MVLAREFFDLQFSLAERVQTLSGQPLEQALFEYTTFYIRFGFGREFASDHEGWRGYLEGMRRAVDPRAWTYDFYRRHADARTIPPLVASFGCFSYAVQRGNAVRIHFSNVDSDGVSPLEGQRADRRRAELAALFGHVRRNAGERCMVEGGSWLYNLSAYRRLFPPTYVASARVAFNRYRYMSLWGQFLDRHGRVREVQALRFSNSVRALSSLLDLQACFPLQSLTVEAPLPEFLDYYGV